MESRMTVVQALDERDLLIKKIMKCTQNARFVDIIRPKATLTWEKRLTRAAFTTAAQGDLQRIQDLIARYDRLNAAIAVSNAATFLETSRGRMPVSCAIALRNRLKGNGPYGELTDFEGRLAQRMEDSYLDEVRFLRRKNETLKKEAPGSKKTTGNIVVLQNKENSVKAELMRIFDPLNIRKKAEAIVEEREALLSELETKIKISNATTYVTV